MAYRYNGVECDTFEELQRLMGAARTTSAVVKETRQPDELQRLIARQNDEARHDRVVPRGRGHHSECACGHCPTEEAPGIGEPGGPCCGKGGDCSCLERRFR